MNLFYIEYTDALANNNWLTAEKAIEWAEKGDKGITQVVGWILKETKEYILVTSVKSGESVTNLEKIPKGWINKKVKIILK